MAKQIQKQLNISLEVHSMLKEISEREGIPMATVIKLLARQYLKRNEVLTLD